VLKPREAVVIETPSWDLTIFKVHFGLLTLKGYTKGEHVARFEAITHNTRALGCGRTLDRFPEIVAKLRSMTDRFTTKLDCVHVGFLPDEILDELASPSTIGTTRVGGVDWNKPRMRNALAAVLAGGSRGLHRHRLRGQGPGNDRPERVRLHHPSGRLRPA